MTVRLLMVAPALPTASGKGYQVRSYHQILGLAPSHEITLVAFGEADRLEPQVAEACRNVVTLPWSLPLAATRAIFASPRLPMSVGLYRDGLMVETLRKASQGCDLAHVVMVRMAGYLEELGRRPVVLDLLDASELNMRERARAAGPGVRQALRVEARRLGAYEKQAIARAARALLISRRDLDYVGSPRNARVVPNGVDVQPLASTATRQPATIVLSGTMNYFPNADAAIWFAREILPLIQRSIPNATFRVVGREPSAKVRDLAALRGVTVTGPVRDIAAEIASATVAVCPMRYGSGMQTKILEAMAVGTPVVATAKALEGIPDDLRSTLQRADDVDDFAAQITTVLRDPAPASRKAGVGLALIAREHTWQRHVEQLRSIYEESLASARNS